MTYEQFNGKLKDEEGYADVEEAHRKMVFESLVEKAKEQDEDVEKNAKKNRKRFVELLQKTREVSASTTYAQATKLLGSDPAWEAVDDATRKQCFDIFVQQLKIQSAARKEEGEEGSGDEEEEEDRKKPKKKRKAEEDSPPAKKSKKAKKAESEAEESEDEKKAKKRKKK